MLEGNVQLAAHMVRLAGDRLNTAQIVADVARLETLSKLAQRFALRACNGPAHSDAEIRADLENDKAIGTICAPYVAAGILTHVEVGGDPRGFVVMVYLSDRHLTNSFGGEGWGIEVH